MIIASVELHAKRPVLKQDSVPESSVVLELFTSQGCSSCPPADELLAKVQRASSTEIIALSYHVDYWNYIGWEDPFSKARYTSRQSRYNQKFGSRSNYTPQLVINGQEHIVGSNGSKLYDRISEYRQVKMENQVSISDIRRAGRAIKFDYDVSGPLEKKHIRAVLVIDKRDTFVQRGENRNRKLTNSNIVISETETDLVRSNGQLQLIIPDLVQKDDELKLVVLLENVKLDITGAVKTNLFL